MNSQNLPDLRAMLRAGKLIDPGPFGAFHLHHRYHAVYRHPELPGWEDIIDNLVMDTWLTNILSIIYGTTAKVTTYYIGLTNGPGSGLTYAAADTMASHSGWTENTAAYSESVRQTCTWPATATAKSISNSAAAAVFNIVGTATIAGCFLCTSNTKGGTAGTLCGAGNFSTGDKSVSAGGTLTVTITATD